MGKSLPHGARDEGEVVSCRLARQGAEVLILFRFLRELTARVRWQELVCLYGE